VVNRVVDPLLQYIEVAASRLPSIDQSAYTLNCIYQIHSSLSLYEYVDDKLESLQVNEFLEIFGSWLTVWLLVELDGQSNSSFEHRAGH